MKRFIVTLGYQTYAVSQCDAVELLAIANRSLSVEQTNYNAPYQPKAEQEPFVSRIELHDYSEQPVDAEPVVAAPRAPLSDDEQPF